MVTRPFLAPQDSDPAAKIHCRENYVEYSQVQTPGHQKRSSWTRFSLRQNVAPGCCASVEARRFKTTRPQSCVPAVDDLMHSRFGSVQMCTWLPLQVCSLQKKRVGGYRETKHKINHLLASGSTTPSSNMSRPFVSTGVFCQTFPKLV